MGAAPRSCCPNRAAAPEAPSAAAPAAANRRDLSEKVHIPGGRAEIGTAAPVLPGDGEGPQRFRTLKPFRIDAAAVTIARFAAFVEDTGYETEAERIGWAFVFYDQLAPDAASEGVAGTEWWRRIYGASWKQPYGPDAAATPDRAHPVTQVSWQDARAFCAWAGGRLPTEAEWEHAARGGLRGKVFPWGNEEPGDGGPYPCNIWQGRFPARNTAADGHRWLAPAESFAPNGYGLYNMVGNTWEWTGDAFRIRGLGRIQKAADLAARKAHQKTAKGGSYLCHRSYCYRYRIAARSGNAPDTATTHLGFRCAYDSAPHPAA